MPRFSDPAPLGDVHRLEGFACGRGSLDIWLVEHARAAAAAGAGSSRTYVVVDGEQGRVVGYHALTVASLPHREATERARRGMPRHPIPALLLVRLAVDESVQGKGIGQFLLRDAMARAVSVAEQAGIRLLLVHAIDNAARAFYERFGFEASPSDPLTLQLLIKDIRTVLDSD